MGLQPVTIVFRLSLKLGGRLAQSEDSYRKIGTSEGHIDIIRNGYKHTWDKRIPQQRVAPCNPTISTKASYVPDTEVMGLFKKGTNWIRYKGSILVHILQYPSLRKLLTNGDLF